MPNRRKYIARFLWFFSIAIALFCYVQYPALFSAQGIASYINQYHEHALAVYCIISLIRGFFLIPSTPFVLAGVLLFPNDLGSVFCISMLGVLFGSSVIYFFSDQLGFGDSLRRKHEGLYSKVEHQMKKHGVFIVLGWSFFPLVPTDLVCCIAGSLKMPFYSFLGAVCIGECILILGYIYSGNAILSWVSNFLPSFS